MEITNKSLDLLQEMVEEAGEHLPQIASEIITMGRIECSLMLIFCITVSVITFKLMKAVLKDNDKITKSLVTTLWVAVQLLPTVMVARYTALAWFFPRLYILEYLK